MKIGILGAGKIGRTVATLLEASEFCTAVRIGDQRACQLPGPKSSFHLLDFADAGELVPFVRSCDSIVSAAPFYLNRSIADCCARLEVAYFDLTEDVESTAHLRRLAATAKVPFVPQCGLAPGAVNIIGASLAGRLDSVRSLELRVGALPLYASNQMKYYLSWSTAGLINEYCQLAEALHNGRRIPTLPLEGLEKVTIDGTEYEAFNTSGGGATMCETFEGRIGELNYKTIRYPGHCNLMRFLLHDLNLASRPKLLREIFDQEVPMTDQDVVIIYVNTVGRHRGSVVQRSFVRKIYGRSLGVQAFSAIQISTAAGLTAMLELHARGELPAGYVKQESVTLEQFLSTKWGRRVYGSLPPAETPPVASRAVA